MNKLFFLILSLIVITPMSISASNDDWSSSMDDSRMRTMMGSGMYHSGMVRPMGSGAMMAAEMKGLHMAMSQLSPADHAALVTMIKEYLTSKGIDPAKYAEIKDQIKDVRKDTREQIKTDRKKMQEEMKMKREEMRAKVKELRSSGKVNVQDMSMTRSTEMGGGKVNVQDISMTK